jgi:hypothetical protein
MNREDRINPESLVTAYNEFNVVPITGEFIHMNSHGRIGCCGVGMKAYVDVYNSSQCAPRTGVYAYASNDLGNTVSPHYRWGFQTGFDRGDGYSAECPITTVPATNEDEWFWG